MTRSRSTLSAMLAAAALALTGCAGSPSAEPVGSRSAPTVAPSEAAPGTDAPESQEPESEAPAAGATLIGVVGTDADPDAYTIALTDESGMPVTSVPAGDYTLTIMDPSDMHNFRLSGEGVDVASDVGAIEELEFEITLVEGTYAFVCDPHVGSMRGELEVTS